MKTAHELDDNIAEMQRSMVNLADKVCKINMHVMDIVVGYPDLTLVDKPTIDL